MSSRLGGVSKGPKQMDSSNPDIWKTLEQQAFDIFPMAGLFVWAGMISYSISRG